MTVTVTAEQVLNDEEDEAVVVELVVGEDVDEDLIGRLVDEEEVLDVEVDVDMDMGREVIVKEDGVEMLKDVSGDELVEVEDLMRLMTYVLELELLVPELLAVVLMGPMIGTLKLKLLSVVLMELMVEMLVELLVVLWVYVSYGILKDV
ncbi:MAG: hypothetical protein Q9199_001142 [Rusavskia elegans]